MKFHLAAVQHQTRIGPPWNKERPTCMMWFHALQCVDKQRPSSHVVFPLFRDNGPLNITPGPESMSHGTPRLRRVGSKIARPILTNLKTRSGLRDSEVHYTILVDS
jgi:hypothetical protein